MVMERYRRALAEYMAEQQPVRMAEGGIVSQADYNAFTQAVYDQIAAGTLTTDQQVIDALAGSLGVFLDRGDVFEPEKLVAAIESVGSNFGQTPTEIANTISVINPAFSSAGYDLLSPAEPPAPDPEPPTSDPTIGGGGDNIDIGGGGSPVTVGDGSDVTVDVPVPDPEPLTLAQSDYDTYTQSVFDRATAGQITPEQIIEEISSGFLALQDQGYDVEADKLKSSVNTVWNRSSTGADVDSEINNALFSLDEILEPVGLDIGDYTFIEPPTPPVEPPPPTEPDIPEDTTSLTGLADTVVALTGQAQTTGDYTTLNQFLQDNNIDTNGLRLLFPDISDVDFQSVLDAGATPFGYTQPVAEPPVVTPTVEDIPDDFYSGFQQYYQGLDSESRGSLASELEDYIAKNVDVGDILASANAQEYEFGGEYSGAFGTEVYNPGLPFYSYRTPEATGIDVSSPFGQYTLSKAESLKSAVAPKNVATFQQQAFGSLPALERESMIRDVVNTIGLEAPDLPELMTEFGVTPEELSLAAGLPLTALPQGLQGVTDFATRTIPGTTPATFIPQVGDITPLSGVSSGLPSLGVQPLPTYTPISFDATPEQVAAATIGAMNAAEAGQS